jgi:hypothetical protein
MVGGTPTAPVAVHDDAGCGGCGEFGVFFEEGELAGLSSGDVGDGGDLDVSIADEFAADEVCDFAKFH